VGRAKRRIRSQEGDARLRKPSTSADQKGEKQRKWLKASCIGCAIVPLLLCSVGGIALKLYVRRAAETLPAELAKLRSLGVPTEPADLASVPPVSDDINAAPLYGSIGYQFEAIKASRTSKEIRDALARYGGPRSQEGDFALVQQGLLKYSDVFNHADKLLTRPQIDFHHDYNKGFKLLFPEFTDQRQLVKWLASKAKLQLETNDPHGALSTIKVMLRVTEHGSQETTLIGSLVCIANHAFAFRSYGEFLDREKADLKLLLEAKKVIEAMHPLANFRRSLGGEVVLARKSIQSLRSFSDLEGEDSGGESVLKLLPLSDSGVRQMFEARYCRMWREVYEKFPKDPTDWKSIRHSMADEARKVEEDKSIENTLNRILFPVYDQACLVFAKQQAERKLMILATQILIDKRSHMPRDLSRYGKMAIDPMSERPFGFKVEGSGFRLWSVGRDLVDNGGVIRQPGSKSSNPTQGVDVVLGVGTVIPTVP
jgi:hypothetical protein